jgi:hypothetical protein
MIDRGYFAKGMACVPGEETTLEPSTDEAIDLKNFLLLV